MPFWGFLTTYAGDGYVANLGFDVNHTEAVVQGLTEGNWLDQHTRAVFVEFSVLNMNSNLFSKFTRVFEFPPYGGMFTWQMIQSIQLYRYTGAIGLFCLVIEGICLIFYLVVVGVEIKRYVTDGWRRIQNVSSILQVCNLILIGFSFSMYIYRTLLTKSTIEKMVNNKGKIYTGHWHPGCVTNNRYRSAKVSNYT